MQYIDAIYGTVKIDEPVLLDLLESAAMQRLKGVSQHGVTSVIGITAAFSRYDHSVGTMILTGLLGASLEEQIAALLHDVSHTAFSHVIDFVFNDHNEQSYHEEKKESFVMHSDIPETLKRHGRNWRDYMEEQKYPLLEQAAPALCADRIDYFLRDLEFLGFATKREISSVLESLVVKNNKITINNTDVARWLAYTFIETDRASWSSFREVGLYHLTAEAIKAAIRLEFINENDLWGNDNSLWQKLVSITHPDVRKYIKLITPGTRFSRDNEHPDFRITSKIRSIDPLVCNGNEVIVLSELDPVFAQYRQQYLAEKQGYWPMRTISLC